jgi:hypothetical protein
MASYGYSNTSSSVDQQQLEALRRELAAKEEAFFDLSATLAAVEAETSHRVQQVEKESGDAAKKLHEQLRRAQQEANLSRSQVTKLQTKLRQQQQQFQQQSLVQQHQQQQQQQHQQPIVTPTNLPHDKTANTSASSEATVQQHATPVTAITPPSPKLPPISSGQRLAQHLLRTTAQYSTFTTTCQENNSALQHAQQQWVLLLSRVATFDSAACTDLQLVTFCIEQCVQTGKQYPEDMDPLLIHLQLTWLQDTLSYSSDSCRALVDSIMVSMITKRRDAVATDYTRASKRGRPSGIRVAGSMVQDESLSSIANALMNPLWTPGRTDTNVDAFSQASFPSRLPLVSQLTDDLTRYILDPCSHPAVSILSMRIIGLLLTHVAPNTTTPTTQSTTVTSSNGVDDDDDDDNNSNNNSNKEMSSSPWFTWWKLLVATGNPKKNILSLWEKAAAVILDRRFDDTKSTRRLPDADMDPTEAPYPDDVMVDTDNNNNDNNNNNNNNNVNNNGDTKMADWKALESAEILDWMATSLHLMNTFWKLAGGGTNIRDQAWWEAGRTRRLTAGVLDILEGIVLGTEKLHASALSLECITWLQCLLVEPRGVMLLRTCMVTSRSTIASWHRGVSAIAVMVRFLHCIVIRQHTADHLPRKSRAINDQLNPTRNGIIRFLDGLLRIVQEDRRVLERKGNAKAITKVVSFYSVLSEYRELYTSAAALLLTVTDSSSCRVDKDLTFMLRLQMEELVIDEEEQDDLQT